MPDGDKVYAGTLPRAYEGPYEELCEGCHSPSSIAYDLLRPLLRDIKRFGMEPIRLLDQIAAQLDQVPQGSLFWRMNNWLEMSREIESVARALNGQPRPMNLAIDVCKGHLRRFQGGDCVEPHLHTLVHSYLQRVYVAQFEHRVPLDGHHNGLDAGIFFERLNEIRPYIVETLRGWADTIMRTQGVEGLRRPSRLRTRVTLDTDLLVGLR